MECAGSFKYQHDTDKDLKFIHVFPKIDVSASAAPAEAEEEADIKIGGMKVPPPLLRVRTSRCPTSWRSFRQSISAGDELGSAIQL